VVPVPLCTGQGATVVEHEGHFWELAPWMPGVADFHANPTRERLRAAMQTLARFHLLAASGPHQASSSSQAPALVERESRVLELLQRQFEPLYAAAYKELNPALASRAKRILEAANPRLNDLYVKIKPASEQLHHIQPAIRDIWHDHVLFTADEVTGIVDFGAMRIDTPLADVARLVGSLVGDDQDARLFALDAYAELRPLTLDDRQLIDVLDESAVVLAGLNWLTWLYIERRDMGPLEPIISRLDEILARLECLPRRFSPFVHPLPLWAKH
jgi:Ser/Thr protein kinase RdoA (MazF antagonist)